MTGTDDDAVYADLREMWERVDPMPADLPDRVIAAIAADDLDLELLTFTAAESLAVRGEAQVLECSTDELTLVVWISDEPDGTRRIDGWTEGVEEVTLLGGGVSRAAVVTVAGRFEFDDLPAGPVRLRLRTPRRGFKTTEFEV